MSTVIRSTVAIADPIPQASLAWRSSSDMTRMASFCALDPKERELRGGDRPPGQSLEILSVYWESPRGLAHIVLKWLRKSLRARMILAYSPAISAVECPLPFALVLTLSIVPLDDIPLTLSANCLVMNMFVLSCTSKEASIAIGIMLLASLVSPRITILRPGISSGGGSRTVPSGRCSDFLSVKRVRNKERGYRTFRWVNNSVALASSAEKYADDGVLVLEVSAKT